MASNFAALLPTDPKFSAFCAQKRGYSCGSIQLIYQRRNIQLKVGAKVKSKYDQIEMSFHTLL